MGPSGEAQLILGSILFAVGTIVHEVALVQFYQSRQAAQRVWDAEKKASFRLELVPTVQWTRGSQSQMAPGLAVMAVF